MARMGWVRATLSCATVIASGCGESATELRPPAPDDADEVDERPACVPDAVAFHDVHPLFESYCGACHGTVPQGGAPFGLLDYDTLVAQRDAGEPIAQAVARVLAARQMPPGGQPRPSDEERARMVAWATCEDFEPLPPGPDEADAGMHTDHDAGHVSSGELEVSREPVPVSGTPPATATALTVTLDEFTPPRSGDHYETRNFQNLVTEDRFIRYFEPIVDDGRVVHHLTLRLGGTRDGYVYVWAPGGEGMEFPDGGIRIGPEDSLRLEVHYHNGAGLEGVEDSSGVRLFVDAPVGTEYGVANIASWDIYVPARGTGTATNRCDVPEDAHVFAALPHMHETGDALSHHIVRKDGGEESLIDLTGWDFHSQRAYAVGVDLFAGDRLDLTCRYVNPTGTPVFAGTATTDEMCFDFVYVTPPNALAACNDQLSQ